MPWAGGRAVVLIVIVIIVVKYGIGRLEAHRLQIDA
ncbi:uncharacterized protein METZ01_LOCUS8402 [marine metagenome]|uniref:Uncharacterized protein n=1 Tax=marine metagenome TaxID=408172 RepID=A0A381NNY9_9ZZZZ